MTIHPYIKSVQFTPAKVYSQDDLLCMSHAELRRIASDETVHSASRGFALEQLENEEEA